MPAACARSFIDRDATGVSERERWDALGMRGTATHGLILEDVFVAEDDALAIPGAFARCMQVSRGSFVGNQLASLAVYAGAAWSVYNATIDMLSERQFADTGKPLGTSPMHQQLIGEMLSRSRNRNAVAAPPARAGNQRTAAAGQVRSRAALAACAKGQVAEHGFRVAVKRTQVRGHLGYQ